MANNPRTCENGNFAVHTSSSECTVVRSLLLYFAKRSGHVFPRNNSAMRTHIWFDVIRTDRQNAIVTRFEFRCYIDFPPHRELPSKGRKSE